MKQTGGSPNYSYFTNNFQKLNELYELLLEIDICLTNNQIILATRKQLILFDNRKFMRGLQKTFKKATKFIRFMETDVLDETFGRFSDTLNISLIIFDDSRPIIEACQTELKCLIFIIYWKYSLS